MCAPGCSECIADYTCKEQCAPEYDNDNTCLHCLFTDLSNLSKPIFIQNQNQCMETNKRIKTKNVLPEDKYITDISFETPIEFVLNNESLVDFSFCRSRQKFTFGRWFSVNMSQLEYDQLVVSIYKLGECGNDLNVDITNSQRDFTNLKCLSHSSLNSSYIGREVRIPKISPYIEEPERKYKYYIYISVTQLCDVKLNLSVSGTSGKILDPFININQNITDNLINNIGTPMILNFPLQAQGYFGFPVCIPHKLFKCLVFSIEYIGNYYLVFDGTKSNKMQYITEFFIEKTSEGVESVKCGGLWNGNKIGIMNEHDNLGISVKFDDKKGVKRMLTVITEDQDYDTEIEMYAICPDNCGESEGRGKCSWTEKKCICSPKYGGDDCHLLCYYNRVWQIDNTSLCYFGALGCDQYCHCRTGMTQKNHFCISDECLSGGAAADDECIAGTEACLQNCQCFVKGGFEPTSEKKCKAKVCGNGMIDKLYDSNDVYMRTEECDNGTNCDKYCRCFEGFKTDPNNPTSCIKVTIETVGIVGIVVGSIVGLVIIIGLVSLILIFAMRYVKVDFNIYKTQQPLYHFYISGSSRTPPSKENRYFIDPVNLDFGNKTSATNINDTRYEKIEVKNFSKNKYMMIIFHVPQSPKYTFYFDPQVMILSPRANKIITCYMTLYCTTRIRDLKMPYTVCSTHIDLDELNMSEYPIAEGANGRVFIGNYRSVPVAIKQFRWENLELDEVTELKKNVIQECEMMSKLRNPFIANYMGSVTYIPQVSMVIQFFVLGSLGEYLRKEKEDYVVLPYKLKVRMLFDTARGMEFLHENRIMHLDLKPDNLLVNSLDPNSACSIKITDFGTSRFTKKSMKKGEEKGLGTPIYAAPETTRDEYTFAGDVYSYGITAWELFYQEEPFKDLKSIFEIKNHVYNGKRLEIDHRMPNAYQTLVESCWIQDPLTRPNFETVCKMVIQINEDCPNHIDLDNNVSLDKIEGLIEKRTTKMNNMLCDVVKE
ncbi:serine-threonine protein kinase, putative [Entamoeba invadens IP1]|uniref:Serine-threonine protein kinase, putative n=1 Tax=Entamoeba invadens IP1 TaxID=370355 RepID=A0A0A1UDL6_ENTIV|nr:serine-threonine protein kinase, putative [Entamoeba invadens IP1]ELP94431.1 serine-threonine protein kinase, putative [Entamoeba invadens IP1]|eukprot:XP_004261202.1 serine-threonine protein kinase, putative [Entamoeba invadens IP1]